MQVSARIPTFQRVMPVRCGLIPSRRCGPQSGGPYEVPARVGEADRRLSETKPGSGRANATRERPIRPVT